MQGEGNQRVGDESSLDSWDAIRDAQRDLAPKLRKARESVALICPGCGNRRERPDEWCLRCRLGLAHD
jgi:hypothetical protein